MKHCGALGCDVIRNLPANDNFVHFYRLHHYKQDSSERRRSVAEKSRQKGKNNIFFPCSFTRSVEEVDIITQIISFLSKGKQKFSYLDLSRILLTAFYFGIVVNGNTQSNFKQSRTHRPRDFRTESELLE